MQSHLRARGVGGRPRAGRALALHTDRAGGLSCVKEAGEWAAGEGGGAHSLFFFFFALVGDSPFVLLPGLPGVGGPCSSEQGRAGEGEKEKQQAAQEVRWGGQGGRGAGVAPGVRHNPVFGSPGEEFPPLHPCPAPPLPSPPQHTVPGARVTSWGP